MMIRTKVVVAGLLVTILLVGLVLSRNVGAQSLQSNGFRYESGLFLFNPNDYIKVNVENLSSTSHTFRVVIFGTINGAPLTSVLDTGTMTVGSIQGAKAEYFVPSTVGGNDYGVEITTDSDKVIPSVSVFANCPNNACTPGSGPRLWLAGSQFTQSREQF